MANNIEKEAMRSLVHIIAYEADNSPLRWTDGVEDNSIFIHNINTDDKVCNVRVWSTSLENSPVRAVYYVYFTGKYSSIAKEIQEPRITGITDVVGYKFILPKHVIDFVKDVVNRKENTKENSMKGFTLATYLFDKLKENNIRYKFINGVYNPEEIVITTKTNHDICRVRSIPDSESSDYSYEAYWAAFACRNINRVTTYRTSDMLIKDILTVERELNIRTLATTFDELPIIKVVDVIFNDPATIVIWADGSKTVVKANGEKFDPEKGLAMAISKKVLGNKHNYYDIFNKHVGRYEKKQKKIKEIVPREE